MNKYLLAVDIGTSGCKTALLSINGAVLATETVSYQVYYPKPGWVEQDPEDWWAAAIQGIKACIQKADINAADIAGIGVDGQSWACIPVDKNGDVLAKTPIWMDTRAQGICTETEKSGLSERIFAISGNSFRPTYTTPKILWFAKNQPDIYIKTRWFLQSNSFIVYRLTGIVSQDVSQGYGLHVFDIKEKQYDKDLCKILDIDFDTLPTIYESCQVVGGVTAAAAKATGLVQGTPVVAGGLDAACGSLGAGVYRPRQTQEQGGQAGGMSICLDTPTASPALILSPHVVPGLWLLQGGTVGGGSSLKWLASQLGQPEMLESKKTGRTQFALLDSLAEEIEPGADGVVFLPYLSGERSPIWDPHATGVLFGLRFSTTRAHLFRALMEGGAFALRHNLDTAEKIGVRVQEMHTMGGAANSRMWTQIKSDVTGKTIRVPDSDMATCKGAAILAGVGVGLYSSFQDAVERLVSLKRIHQPNMSIKPVYDDNYATYLQLYQQLKPVMAEAAKNGRR